MKKVLCLIFAALLLAAAGCSGGKGKSGASPSPTPASVNVPTDVPDAYSQTKTTPGPESTGKPIGERDYGNAVVFENGRAVFGAFNWQYFCAKAGALMSAEIRLIELKEGAETIRTLSYEEGVFVIEGEGMRKSYKYFKTANVSDDAGGFTGEIAYLTNDPDLAADELIAGLSEPVGVGAQCESGFVVYVNRAS
jgi:hypothetical protein